MYYLAAKQYSRAEEYFLRSLRSRPEGAEALNNLAVVNLVRGRFDEADRNISKAIEILPNALELRNTQKAIAEGRSKAADGAR